MVSWSDTDISTAKFLWKQNEVLALRYFKSPVNRTPPLQCTYNGGYGSKEANRSTGEPQQRFLFVKWSLLLDNPVFLIHYEREDVTNAVCSKTSVPTYDVTGCSPHHHIQCKVLLFQLVCVVNLVGCVEPRIKCVWE
jgi:hypothetical protein